MRSIVFVLFNWWNYFYAMKIDEDKLIDNYRKVIINDLKDTSYFHWKGGNFIGICAVLSDNNNEQALNLNITDTLYDYENLIDFFVLQLKDIKNSQQHSNEFPYNENTPKSVVMSIRFWKNLSDKHLKTIYKLFPFIILVDKSTDKLIYEKNIYVVSSVEEASILSKLLYAHYAANNTKDFIKNIFNTSVIELFEQEKNNFRNPIQGNYIIGFSRLGGKTNVLILTSDILEESLYYLYTLYLLVIHPDNKIYDFDIEEFKECKDISILNRYLTAISIKHNMQTLNFLLSRQLSIFGYDTSFINVYRKYIFGYYYNHNLLNPYFKNYPYLRNCSIYEICQNAFKR